MNATATVLYICVQVAFFPTDFEIIFIYLKGRFILQMAKIAETGLAQSQELGNPSESPTWVAGVQS